MFRSCLQRPKSVIFEGLVTRFGYGVGGESEKKKRKRVLRQRILEKEYEFEKK